MRSPEYFLLRGLCTFFNLPDPFHSIFSSILCHFTECWGTIYKKMTPDPIFSDLRGLGNCIFPNMPHTWEKQGFFLRFPALKGHWQKLFLHRPHKEIPPLR